MQDIGEIMSRSVVTLKETDDLGLVDAILALGRIRHLPVVRDGKVVGLVTHRDLLRAWATRDPSRTRTTLAADIMTREVTTVTADTPLPKAARLLETNKFGCLPVVDRDGYLVGIVTEADFVEFAAQVAESYNGSPKIGHPSEESPSPQDV